MNLDQLFRLFERAREICGHRDYVVMGSLSVLGLAEDTAIPPEMSMSIDVDGYTQADPVRVFDLKAALGEDSEFHAAHGYYLDPMSPHLPSLPDGWAARLHQVERGGVRLWFLEPNDAAVSKYARSEPRDVRWVRAGILAGLVSLPSVRARLRSTRFLDEEEAHRVRAQTEADAQWFEGLKAGRSPPTERGRNAG